MNWGYVPRTMTKIAFAQISQTYDIGENVAKHLQLIESLQADIIVFPECSITGYDPVMLERNIHTIAEDLINARLKLDNACKRAGKKALIGTPEITEAGVYNSSMIVGDICASSASYRKRCLVDAEQTVFKPGSSHQVLSIHDKKIGILICRDQSHPVLFSEYQQLGVELIIIQAAHYYAPLESLKKRKKNIAIPIVRAMDSATTIAKVNAVGQLGASLSCGNSIIADSLGNVLGLLGETEEGSLYYNL